MKKTMFALVLTLAALTGVRPALACSCAPNPPPREALAQSSAVFAGKVLEVYRQDRRTFRVTFDVSVKWKGRVAANTNVLTATESSLCGYGFEVGSEYIVYTYSTIPGRLHASLCSRTALLANAAADLAALGPGEKPALE